MICAETASKEGGVFVGKNGSLGYGETIVTGGPAPGRPFGFWRFGSIINLAPAAQPRFSGTPRQISYSESGNSVPVEIVDRNRGAT